MVLGVVGAGGDRYYVLSRLGSSLHSSSDSLECRVVPRGREASLFEGLAVFRVDLVDRLMFNPVGSERHQPLEYTTWHRAKGGL